MVMDCVRWASMKHKPPSKRDLLRSSEPWFPIISRVCQAAFRDVLAGVPVLGNPRKTERANDLHRAVRENFRRVCDLGHFLRLVEEPEGKGLDYIVSSLNPDVQIGYRWGRYDGVAVRRNPSLRTKDFHEQGTLFSLVDDEPSGMPMLTVGLAIADDFWEANKPCCWLGRIMLLQ